MDIDPDYGDRDVFEAESAHGSSAVNTDYNMSVDFSPAPSMHSYSSSRDGSKYFLELGGRKLNAKNEVYTLPAGALLRIQYLVGYIQYLSAY